MAKVCPTCKVEKLETNFSKDRSTRDGLRHSCRDCNIAYKKTHKEQISVRRKQYYVEHREVLIHKTKMWQNNNKDANREAQTTWRKNHPEVSHRDASHRDASRNAAATWKKNHPEAIKVQKQTRRAKKAGLASTLTPEQWKHILDKFNNTCAYCGAGDKTLHQEHFISVSSEGEYTHNNIIPACGRCNSSKGTRDFFFWYPTSDGYDKKREKKIMKFLHYTGAAQQLTLCT